MKGNPSTKKMGPGEQEFASYGKAGRDMSSEPPYWHKLVSAWLGRQGAAPLRHLSRQSSGH